MKGKHDMRNERVVMLALVVAAVSQLVIQLAMLVSGGDTYVQTIATDDAFYYIAPAWNFANHGVSTFDGIHVTNGYQPLWFLVLSVFALFTPYKEMFPQVALGVSFALSALAFIPILRIGRLVRSAHFTLIAAALWSLMSFASPFYSNGMENNLHALLIWLAIAELVALESDSRRPIVYIAVFAAAIVWTRLDSVVFVVVMFAVLIHIRRREALRAGVIATALIAPIPAVLYLLGGTILPISTIAKMTVFTYAEWFRVIEDTTTFWRLLLWHMPHVAPVALQPVQLAAFAVAIVILVKARYQHRIVAGLAVALVATCLAILISSGEYHRALTWYRSPAYVSWIVVVSLAVAAVIRRSVVRSRVVSIGVLGIAAALIIASYPAHLSRLNYYHTLMSGSAVEAITTEARIIRETTPLDTRIASWDCGNLGWYSERKTINLDGLANNADYYNRVLIGNTQLLDYLRENDVSYVIGYAVHKELTEYPIIRSYPIRDGTPNINVIDIQQTSLDYHEEGQVTHNGGGA